MNEIENNIQPADEAPNIKRYLFKTIINWPLFLISLTIALSIAYLVIRYTEPQYKVSSTIIINEEQKGFESLFPVMGRNLTKRNMFNEIAKIKSYSVINQSLIELNFEITYNVVGRIKERKVFNQFFQIVLDTSKTNLKYVPVSLTFLNSEEILLEYGEQNKTKKRIRFGNKFENEDFSFWIIKIKDFNPQAAGEDRKLQYSFVINDLNNLTREYIGKLSVTGDEKQGSIITLSSSGPIPDKEAKFVNKVSEIYLRNNLNEKNQAAENAIRFIDNQLNVVGDSLKKNELRLQDFRTNRKVFDILDEEKIISERLIGLQKQKYENGIKLKYCSYIRDYINKKADFSDVMAPGTFGLNDDLLNKSITQLIDLYNQKRELKLSVSETSPAFKILNLKIDNVRKTLVESLNELENTTLYDTRICEEAIQKEEEKLYNLPPIEREYLSIKREYDINNSIFTFLLQKRAEAGITRASNKADNKVIDEALSTNAVLIKPKRSSVYSTAILLGLAIPFIIIFLMEFLNNQIVDIKDLSRLRKSSIIVSLGHNNKNTETPVFEYPKSSLAESFRGLRTNLQFILREKDDKSILVTSTISGEGKTFCAVNLGIVLSMANKKVLLMAFDLRKPKIHRYLNIPNKTGISSYLSNQAQYEEIIVPTNINNLFFAPAGPVPPNPAELLETENMEKLIKKVKEDFDYIIFDTPPVAVVTDALLISKYASCSLFVVRQNYSTKD
ncbi:MAG TPA: polysaccharide biosynthesis tyrosine autokinase, partial [Bacteroidales bacterium]